MRDTRLIVARGTGVPASGRKRTWPLRWRRWILESPTQKHWFRKWERRRRARFSRSRALPNFAYLLSFPRSGSHLVRYVIESVTGYPTLGAREGFTPSNTILWIDTPIYVKVPIKMASRSAIAIKRHRMNKTDINSAPIVAVIRRPDQAIVSHVGLDFAMNNVQESVNDFVALCQTVDAWPSQTSLHWYEDMTSSDSTTFRAATSRLLDSLSVVEYGTALDNFLNNRDAHNRRALASLERPPQSDAFAWDEPRVRAVTQEIISRLTEASGSSPTLSEIVTRYFGGHQSRSS